MFQPMYLDVTTQVNSQLGQGFSPTRCSCPTWTWYSPTCTSRRPCDLAAVPLAWRPLVEQRAAAGIEPIQFALAGMNAHINHHLPLATVNTCTALAT